MYQTSCPLVIRSMNEETTVLRVKYLQVELRAIQLRRSRLRLVLSAQRVVDYSCHIKIGSDEEIVGILIAYRTRIALKEPFRYRESLSMRLCTQARLS